MGPLVHGWWVLIGYVAYTAFQEERKLTEGALLSKGLFTAGPVTFQRFLVGVDEAMLLQGLSSGEPVTTFFALKRFACVEVSRGALQSTSWSWVDTHVLYASACDAQSYSFEETPSCRLHPFCNPPNNTRSHRNLAFPLS